MVDAYLLDTNIASIVWDGASPSHSFVRQEIEKLGESSIAVCSISVGEFEYGLQVSPAVDAERHQIARQAMMQYYVWNIDSDTGVIYGRLRGELFKKFSPRNHRERLKNKWPEDLLDTTTAKTLGIQENDLWIVSLAIQYNLRLITSDKMERILEVADKVDAYQRAIIWDLSGNSEKM